MRFKPKLFLVFGFLLLVAVWLIAQTITGGGLAISCNAVTTTGACTAFALAAPQGNLPAAFTWQTITTGSPTTVAITLEGSIDGSNYTTLDTSTSTGGEVRSITGKPMRLLRCNLGTLSGGTTPSMTCQFTVTSSGTGGGGAGGGVSSLTFTAPLTGGTITTTGTVGCATCAIGPGSSTANHVAEFSGTDGVTLKDGGAPAIAWDQLQNAANPLTLANGTNATTFNQTSTTNWTWANTTTSTSGTTGQSSPIINLCGTFFNATISGPSCWTMQNVMGTAGGASTPTTLTFGQSGTGGSIQFAIPQGGGLASVPQYTWAGALGYGLSLRSGVALDLTINTNDVLEVQASSFEVGNATPIGWGSTANPHNSGRDSAWSRLAANVGGFGNGAQGDTSGTIKTAAYMSVGTTFTASGCANSTLVGGATAGKYTSVTAGSCTVTITMGNSATAPNGWACDAHDITTVADANNVTLGASTTTTANLVEGTVAANDVIVFKCGGY